VAGEVGGSSAANEVAVGIMSMRQLDDAGCDASIFEAEGELVRSFLPGWVARKWV